MDIMQAIAQVTLYVGFAGFVVKGLIDAFKARVDPPTWVAPVAAILGGIIVVGLVMLVQGLAFSSQLAGTAVLAGVLAGLSAIGATQLQELERGGPAERLERVERRT